MIKNPPNLCRNLTGSYDYSNPYAGALQYLVGSFTEPLATKARLCFSESYYQAMLGPK